MPQAIDDVNVTTILSILLKLGIENNVIITSIIPFCYKISDYNRLLTCIHMISMMQNSKKNPSFKALVIKSALELPINGSTLTFKEIGRLCESLAATKLYSENLGNLIIWLLNDDLEDHKVEIVSFSSILRYLSRMKIGDLYLWRIYSKYALENIITGNPKTIIKLLESFVDRGFRSEALLGSCGHILVNHISGLNPMDIVSLAHIYHLSNYNHYDLFSGICDMLEIIVGLIDSKTAIKLLGFLSYVYGQTKTYFTPKHYRSIYLIFNKCSIALEIYDIKDFMVLAQGIKQFHCVKSMQLEKRLVKYLNECSSQYTLSLEGKKKSQIYASIILSKYRNEKRITQSEALTLKSQLSGAISLS
ncbi:conserved hypothetical protein [Theileria equi strain WA]|uniref:Uncharacterized protein n=1 Tax=Theileria equi strain WA TaxID=1537102 RepID=L1LG58_THEEQ|nr:conserved hypothetical protein [Theileria equi strain WA]EKX74336.1 conserved hypothetical protein [Theileria equi strain WA]|eukprot:XP_004833788.1 conserved hypothetical protein [Theileria equi strain WA]